MYKGNMFEFCEKVDNYLRRTYDCMLRFGETPMGGRYVAFFGPSDTAAEGYEVFDTEDFEDQIYEFINDKLSGNV